MRSIILSAILSLSLTASANSFARLHVPKEVSSKILTDGALGYSEVAKIISDVVGVGSLLNSENVEFKKPTSAHLLIVGNAMEESLPGLDKFEIIPEDTKNSMKTWKLLRGSEEEGNVDVHASVLEIFTQANPGSLHISLSGNSEYLNAISINKKIVPKSNSVSVLADKSLKPSTCSCKLSSAFGSIVSEDIAKNINQAIFEDKFLMSIASDRSFIAEYTALVQLNKLIQTDSQLTALVIDEVPDFYAIAISSLWELHRIDGSESEKYQIAKSKMELAIQEFKDTLEKLYKGQVSTQAISFEGESSSIKISRRIAKRDAHETLSPCFATEAVCQNSTNSCSSHGRCIFVKSRTVAEIKEECYKCDCASGYTGDICEFEDKVAVFHLIFWTSLILILSLIVITVTLAYMDPGTDTLLFRTGSQRLKSE